MVSIGYDCGMTDTMKAAKRYLLSVGWTGMIGHDSKGFAGQELSWRRIGRLERGTALQPVVVPARFQPIVPDMPITVQEVPSMPWNTAVYRRHDTLPRPVYNPTTDRWEWQ